MLPKGRSARAALAGSAGQRGSLAGDRGYRDPGRDDKLLYPD